MPGTPPPIDPRGPRFNQAVLTAALVAGFLADARWVVPVWAGVLFLGAAFGPRYGPFLRLYADVVRPRLRPPADLEDPRPPRFAAAVGVAFLVAAAVAFAAGAVGLGWALALVVAALAALAAVTGICVGCEIYLWLVLGRRKATGAAARVPAHIVDGAERTWVVFTTPYCASCGPVAERLRAGDPGARVVTVDATEDPDLADAFAVRRAPTVLLADAAGEVQARLVGPAAVEGYVKAGRSTAAR
ncbi:MAG TPA: DUF4395 family protein [Acidimicrobiales bacterium]|nr:DUF4395 family protein [Acidimicrobiales bacterium]